MSLQIERNQCCVIFQITTVEREKKNHHGQERKKNVTTVSPDDMQRMIATGVNK